MEKLNVVMIDAEDAIKNFKEAACGAAELNLVGEFSSGENVVEKTIALQPDLIILDLLIPGADGFEIIEQVKAKLPTCRFILASSLNSLAIVSKATEMGVDYYMVKPVDSNLLAKRAKELCAASKTSKSEGNKKLEEKITNIFLTVGIPAHIKGYQFLREAIKMAVSDPYVINNITKKLYPGIAEIYSTTASKVERAIRHAIEVAWNKGKIENINDVFGLHVYDTHEKPTNGEFIALVADKMLLEKY